MIVIYINYPYIIYRLGIFVKVYYIGFYYVKRHCFNTKQFFIMNFTIVS